MLSILGRLLIVYSSAMVIPIILAVINKDSSSIAFLVTIFITIVLGLIFMKQKKINIRGIGAKEAIATVAAAWMLITFLSALPYNLSGAVPTYIDALFEASSGLTTTGASVISDVEIIPASILLWRSMTQWLGGMGIIVLFIILLPNTGIGAVHLFNAEVPGPVNERVMPRIRDTALILWKIYILLTTVLTMLLWLAGMGFFDAVNHAFTTMATGGFSTKNTSIAYFDSLLIEVIISFFMILAGVNFGIFLLLLSKKSLKPFRNTELFTYLLIILAAIFAIAASLWLSAGKSLEYAFRYALFQVASISTTTGYATADFDVWPALAKIVLLVLMFIGGCAGSTAGGMKVSRVILLLKSVRSDLKKIVQPHKVTCIQLDGKAVDRITLSRISIFFFIYMFFFVIASIIMAGTGLEPFDAMSAAAATLGNIGPGFGVVGPTTTYASISLFGKFVLSICMLLGRLEFFTLLILVNSEFWRHKGGW